MVKELFGLVKARRLLRKATKGMTPEQRKEFADDLIDRCNKISLKKRMSKEQKTIRISKAEAKLIMWVRQACEHEFMRPAEDRVLFYNSLKKWIEDYQVDRYAAWLKGELEKDGINVD